MKMVLFAWIVLAVSPWMARADAGQREARIRRLQDSLLAPCCYQETVLRHQSDVAVKMRREIRDWVDAGRTDREILDAYKQRFGAKILTDPEGEAWWWNNAIPWVLSALGIGVVIWLLTRWRARPVADLPAANAPLPPVPESDEEWARLESPGRLRR